jgi:hypothetical protein
MTDNTPEELAKELKETRERLGKSVEELQDYVRPGNIADRGVKKVTGFFVDEDGAPRAERIAAVSAGVLAFFGIVFKARKSDSDD